MYTIKKDYNKETKDILKKIKNRFNHKLNLNF